MDTNRLYLWTRSILVFFTVALFASGLTAIPLRFELGILNSLVGNSDFLIRNFPALVHWISRVYNALNFLYDNYLFLVYGYDLLAFGHFVIAIAFLGAIKDPVKNRWVIEFGMIACVLLIPYAFIFGHYRDIPILWRLIDFSFGIVGIIPLFIARKFSIKLERVVDFE
jgi:hypothetical protein